MKSTTIETCVRVEHNSVLAYIKKEPAWILVWELSCHSRAEAEQELSNIQIKKREDKHSILLTYKQASSFVLQTNRAEGQFTRVHCGPLPCPWCEREERQHDREGDIENLWEEILEDFDADVDTFDKRATEKFGKFICIIEPEGESHEAIELLQQLGALTAYYPPFVDSGEGEYFMVWLSPELKKLYLSPK